MSYMYGLEDEDGAIYGMMSFVEKQYVKHSRNEGGGAMNSIDMPRGLAIPWSEVLPACCVPLRGK